MALYSDRNEIKFIKQTNKFLGDSRQESESRIETANTYVSN